MKKKILTECILTSSILIIVSFSNVVGYQSIESTNDEYVSPLFNLRLGKTIDKEDMEFSCNYVGKNKRDNLHVSKVKLIGNSLENLINFIKKMDEDSIRRFVTYIAFKLGQNDNYYKFDVEEIYLIFKHIKDNQFSSMPYLPHNKLIDITSDDCSLTMDGRPLYCLLYILLLFWFLWIQIVEFYMYLIELFTLDH